MSEIDDLRRRMESALARRRAERDQEQERLEESMTALEHRQARFAALARRLFDDILEPALRALEEHFDDCRYVGSDREFFGTVAFNLDGRYKAAVKLEMDVTSDGNMKTVVVAYHLRIIPVLMKFRSRDEFSCPLDEVEDAAVAAFVDDKIVEAAETYLALQKNPRYQTR